MRRITREPWSGRRQSLSAGESTMLGLAIGLATAVAASLNPPREFTFSFLTLLLSIIGPCGAICGYGAWLLYQPSKFEKVRKIAMCLAVIMIAGLLIRFPSILWEIGSKMGAFMMITLAGFIFSMSFFIAIAGYGIAQLIVHYVRAERAFDAPTTPGSAGGMWDRELDFG